MLVAATVASTAWAQSPIGGGVLVTPAWLAEHLTNPRIRVVDLGKTAAEFEAAHIPGAQFVDWRVDIVDASGRAYFEVAPAPAIERLLSRLGVDTDTTVVLYDSQSSRIAARMFWVLRYYGHDDVRILDGGTRAWEAAGRPLTSAVTSAAPTDYRARAPRERYRAERADVQAAIQRPGYALVDARAPEFFTGESAGSQFGSDVPNEAAGHVPGAANFFWADHYNADGTFKPPSELRDLYAALGIERGETVITYCHVGLQASTPWFVLTELLGYPNVRLYDRSMAEWANLPGAPLDIGSH